MKYISILLLIFTLTLSQNLFSQTDTLTGKKGLIFSVSGLYLGGGLGGKYWLSSKNVLRLNLDGNYTNNPDSRYSVYSVSTVLGIENHFESLTILSPYIGGSLGFTQSYSNANISYSRSLDFSGFVGIELWIYRNITLSGEQAISFSYSKNVWNTSYFYTINVSTSKLLLSIYL